MQNVWSTHKKDKWPKSYLMSLSTMEIFH